MHRTPISERSGAEIEFIEMPEFYLGQLKEKIKIKKFAEDKINFYPENSKKILFDWIEQISIDWPISRRRFYATEIPLWFAEKDGKKLVALPTEKKYYQPWKESVPKNAEVWCEGKKIGEISEFAKLNWQGETRVFDTWMDSSISELFLVKYHEDDEFFKKAFPVTLRPQGKEIVRTWLYYTLLRGYLETGKPCFKDVWIHQHILDSKGFKMSKSKGNVIDPHELLKEYGAEAIRLWSATEGDLSKTDFICSKEKINAEKKTLNKLLNVSKFVDLFEKPTKMPKLTKRKLFLDYLENLTEFCDENYEKYDFNKPAQKLRYFLWEIFASHYIELVKARATIKKTNSQKKKANLQNGRFTHYLKN
jgi:valyl-tRNA synthetase